MKRRKNKKVLKSRLARSEMREMLYHGRYVLPNAVTVGNMFFGFLAIIYATSGRFDKATLAIIAAIIFDGFDGRVARRFNATSRFGLEFDSLADLVSFGVAPAILMYQWCFQKMADEFGVLVCFIYCVGAASRLARFNVTETNLRAFEGLPSPAAAGIVAAVVFATPGFIPDARWHVMACATLMVLVGYLMVSRIEYFSIKQLKVRQMPTFVLLAVAAVIGVIWYEPRILALIIFGGYCLSGLVGVLFKAVATRKVKKEVVPSVEVVEVIETPTIVSLEKLQGNPKGEDLLVEGKKESKV
ncbi:MAG: CDP-diacylglycerol--serine O-phosphatidyltransferase [Bdellovibrionota bacterium]